jgi:hypothetical protein
MIDVKAVAVRSVEVLATLCMCMTLAGVIRGVPEAYFPVIELKGTRAEKATVNALFSHRWLLVIYAVAPRIFIAHVLWQRGAPFTSRQFTLSPSSSCGSDAIDKSGRLWSPWR